MDLTESESLSVGWIVDFVTKIHPSCGDPLFSINFRSHKANTFTNPNGLQHTHVARRSSRPIQEGSRSGTREVSGESFGNWSAYDDTGGDRTEAQREDVTRIGEACLETFTAGVFMNYK